MDGVASGRSQRTTIHSPCTIVSHGLEWLLKVQPSASDAAAAPAAATRPVQLGFFLMNSFQFAVPQPPHACKLIGLSFRLEAARLEGQPAGAADAAAAGGGRPGVPGRAGRAGRGGAGVQVGPWSVGRGASEWKQSDMARPDGGVGHSCLFPILTSGSVDDPSLAPFVHAGPGGAKMLRLRGEVLGLE